MSLWSILPSALQGIRAAVAAGRPADMPPTAPGAYGFVSIESEGEDERPYHVTPDGTAIVQMRGPIYASSAPWWLVWITDGTTYGYIVESVTRAVEDALVQRVVLDIDSPGGMVTGCAEAAAALRALRDIKPITAYARGYCASAAYWLAAQCSDVAAAATAPVGCLGVRVDLYLYDRMYAEAGIDHVVVTSAETPRKAPDLSSEEGRADVQRMCDVIFDAFVSDVAAGRGVDEAWVRGSMGAGACLVGPDAQAAKLIDRIAIGPEAACQPQGDGEATIETPPDSPESPTPGAAGHTLEVPTMGKPETPAAAQQPDPREAQFAALVAERDALASANAALSARVAEFDAAAKASAEQARITTRDTRIDAENKRVGKNYPRAQFTALADQIGIEAAMTISATYPSAAGLPTKLSGQEEGVETPKTRAELNKHIEAQAKAEGKPFNEIHARLRQENPGLFALGGDSQ